MSDQLAVDLFVEDRAHEEFLKPLLMRVASEAPGIRVAKNRGSTTLHNVGVVVLLAVPR